MTRPFDVVVLGAGPAGTAAALRCAAGGLRTVLAARARDGSDDRVESVFGAVDRVAEALGILHALESSSVGSFSRLSVESAKGLVSTMELPEAGRHLSRSIPARELRAALDRSGVATIDADCVNVRTSQHGVTASTEHAGEVVGRWLIDGTGRRRVARRALGGRVVSRSPAMLANVQETPVGCGRAEEARLRARPTGWTWEVAAGSRLARTELFVGRRRPEPGVEVRDVRWRSCSRIAGRHVLLVGDAAGTLDPAAGQGILAALRSGAQAAETVARAEREPAWATWHLGEYEALWHATYAASADALSARYRELGVDLRVSGTTKHTKSPSG